MAFFKPEQPEFAIAKGLAIASNRSGLVNFLSTNQEYLSDKALKDKIIHDVNGSFSPLLINEELIEAGHNGLNLRTQQETLRILSKTTTGLDTIKSLAARSENYKKTLEKNLIYIP